MLVLRLLVAAGCAAYVAGAWAGWFLPVTPGGEWPRARAHELAGVVGEWAWLGLVPLLAAIVVPYHGRAQRWLWLAALPPLGWAAWCTSFPLSAPDYPFYPDTSATAWGLWVSLAGAGLSFATLVLVAVMETDEPARARRALPAYAAAAGAVLLAVVLLRGPGLEGAERSLREHLAAQEEERVVPRGTPPTTIRVTCRDRLGRPPTCSHETAAQDGSAEGGSCVTRDREGLRNC